MVRGKAPDTPASVPDTHSHASLDLRWRLPIFRSAHSPRSRGHSFAGALAYRLGLRLVDANTGQSHNYTRRHLYGEIADTGLGRPPGT